jgi:hypothetical protein
MLAALLSLGYAVLGPDENTAGVFNHSNYVIANLLNTIRQGLLALGVIGLGLSLRGKLAAAGFLVMFFGTVLVVGLDVDKTFILPYLATVNPSITHMGNFAQNVPPLMQNYMVVFLVALLLYFVGPLLLGIAIVRDSRLPRWLGVVLIVGNILQYGNMFGVAFLHSIGVAVFGLALGWLGYKLWAWQTTTSTVTQPQLVH